MSKKPYRVAFIGARVDGQAGVVADVLSYHPQYQLVAYFDNTPGLKGSVIDGVPVLGDVLQQPCHALEDIDYFHIAMGDNKARLEIYHELKRLGKKLLTLVHPSAVLSRRAEIGEGCFIGAQAVVQNGCRIGVVCLLNTASVVEHDNQLGDAVHMAPNSTTGGRASISELAFIGIGATILPDIAIGRAAFIGAGTVICKDVPDEITMIGYAAKVHQHNIYRSLAEVPSELAKSLTNEQHS